MGGRLLRTGVLARCGWVWRIEMLQGNGAQDVDKVFIQEVMNCHLALVF